jgi:NTE family protein
MGGSAHGGRALVCGGGGVTGIAWMLGVIAGLAEAGVDLERADLTVGTSAGSVVGAQLAAGIPVEKLYAAQLDGGGAEIAARLGFRAMVGWGWAALSSRDPQRARVRIGRMALRADTMPEERRRAVFEARLPVHQWPDHDLRVTASDAQSGEFVVFDRTSGVALVDAVGASCAVPGVWPPVTIGGRRYVDGGVRSPTNADLAAGCARVVVLAPIGRGVDRQVAGLRAAGARVAVVRPSAAARRAIGRNVLDPTRRGPSARAGREQAAQVRADVAAVWAG